MNLEGNEIQSGRQPCGCLVLRAQAMPKDTNSNGDIFGGWLLAQMDIAAWMMAGEITNGRTVTITLDKMVFKLPVHTGDIVSIYGELVRVGHSSLDIRLEVWAKQLSGEFVAERHLVTEGVFGYVAIDEHGSPRKVPDNPHFPRPDKT